MNTGPQLCALQHLPWKFGHLTPVRVDAGLHWVGLGGVCKNRKWRALKKSKKHVILLLYNFIDVLKKNDFLFVVLSLLQYVFIFVFVLHILPSCFVQ